VDRLGTIIQRFLTRERFAVRHSQGPVFRRWPEVVGEILADRCRPVAVRKGVLVVHVQSSVWMHELQMQKMEILERIQSLLGVSTIQDIRWTLRGGGNRSAPRRKKAAMMPPSRPLDEEEKAWLQAVAAQVSDSDLRETVARVLEKHLRQSGPG
jgi:predicted nucleic acid-binding Zn ribbon protein